MLVADAETPGVALAKSYKTYIPVSTFMKNGAVLDKFKFILCTFEFKNRKILQEGAVAGSIGTSVKEIVDAYLC